VVLFSEREDGCDTDAGIEIGDDGSQRYDY
jgi:hypothetical protein